MNDTDIQTFRGGSMREALAKVREALGPDAVILATRQRVEKSLLGKRSNVVEITASATMTSSNQGSLNAPSEDAAAQPKRTGILPPPSASASKVTSALQGAGGDSMAEQLRARLENLELPADVVRECLDVAQHSLSRRRLLDDAWVQEHLSDYLASRIRTKPSLEEGTGVIFLVGPSGAGKSSIAAKLAASAIAKDQRPVCLATIDDVRIGARAELERYADILGTRCLRARTPIELRQKIEDGPGDELVLIDTPGTNPIDGVAVAELARFMELPSRVWLVLPVTARDTFLRVALDAFRRLDYERLILTKLDETTSPGAILSIATMSPVPIGLVSMGPDASRDLEPADARGLARWILKETGRASDEMPRLAAA